MNESILREALEKILQHDSENDNNLHVEQYDAIKEALAATAAPEQPNLVAERGTYWLERIMDQAQFFASSWAIYGSRLDTGEGQANAEQARAELRAMIEVAAPQQERDRDAERYRWLARRVSGHGVCDGWGIGFPTHLSLPASALAMRDPEAALGEAIDAAIATAQKE